MNKKNLSVLFVLLVIAAIILFNTMSTSDRLYETFANPANSTKCRKLVEQKDTMKQILMTKKPQNDEDRKGRAALEIELTSVEKQIKELGC
jgi:hypothetical protein